MDATTQTVDSACPREKSIFVGEPEIVQLIQTGDEERALKLLSSAEGGAAVDPNLRTIKGSYSLLHMAALSDMPLLTSRLLALGALPDSLDRDGFTALHYAVSWEATEAIKALIQGGASLNARTRDNMYYLSGSIPIEVIGGRTALHLAAEKGYSEIAQMLMEAGADPYLDDHTGRTAYDIAVNQKHINIANLIQPTVTEHISRVPPNDVADRNGVITRLATARKKEKKDYRAFISGNYRPLHPEVFSVHENMFDEHFLRAIKSGSDAALRSLLSEVHPGIYSFPMLRLDYCSRLLEELDHLEQSGLPLKRPNSMNAYGVILSDVGFKQMMLEFMQSYVCPIATLVYPDHGGAALDKLHSFVVKYKIGEDLDLKEHVDDSEVTLNVSLGKTFTGGNLDFNGLANTEKAKNDHFTMAHSPGVAVLHLGSHWHSALKIHEGERWNLIMWCRSSARRGKGTQSCGNSGPTS